MPSLVPIMPWIQRTFPVKKHILAIAAAGMLLAPPSPVRRRGGTRAPRTPARRQFEEIVVTAERRESTVQDTAIAITAFTGEFIEDFGLRNQEDLQNYLPATTIQPYDLSIRGVGRLFRALGGDPGVATYYDGAYSEDFGIASTEGGLFDIERIEFLRGPQGTLYGRNGVGGAVNFHSKKPTDEFEGELRANVGSFNTRELFGVVSGPIIEGVLNARANGVKRTRDGFMNDVQPGNPDINDYGDENYSLALEWLPADNLSVLVRGNERSYRRSMSGAQGAGAIVISEQAGHAGPGDRRRALGERARARLAADRGSHGGRCPDVRQRHRPLRAQLHRAHGSGALHQRRQPLVFVQPQRRDPLCATPGGRRGPGRLSRRTAPPFRASRVPTMPTKRPSIPRCKPSRTEASRATGRGYRS